MIKSFAKKIYLKVWRFLLPLFKFLNTRKLIREYDANYGKGNYIIINPPQGMGDILACCCGVEYLRTEGKTVFVLVNKKYYSDIKSFFPNGYVQIVYSPKYFSDKSYKTYMPLSHKMYFPDKPYISMKYNMCLAMGISSDVVFHNQYKKLKNLGNLPQVKEKKTIMISPFATSCYEELSPDFWDSLSHILYNNGYDVIFNAPSDSIYSHKHKTCLLNLEESVELASKCGYFIGWRSGLCDIIGMFSDAKKIVIYPSNPSISPYMYIPESMSYPEAFLKSCSLKTLWGVDAEEIINNPNLLNQITKMLGVN